jgi:hypothetical protein
MACYLTGQSISVDGGYTAQSAHGTIEFATLYQDRRIACPDRIGTSASFSAMAMVGCFWRGISRAPAAQADQVDELEAVTLQRNRETGVELIMGSGRFTDQRTLEVRLNEGGMREPSADLFSSVPDRATWSAAAPR